MKIEEVEKLVILWEIEKVNTFLVVEFAWKLRGEEREVEIGEWVCITVVRCRRGGGNVLASGM